MFKLMILIEPEVNETALYEGWPQFLALAENLPGLVRIVTAPVHSQLTGIYRPLMVHELHFHSREALREAMTSEEGKQAGETLQRITGGAITLLLAGHMEDTSENLRAYHPKKAQDSEGGNDD